MGSLHGAITVRFIVTNWSLKIHRMHICHGYVPIASVDSEARSGVATVTVTVTAVTPGRAYSDSSHGCAMIL